MSKNESFKARITIDIKGVSTNGFVPKLIRDQMRAHVSAINVMYQQTDATFKYEDLKGKK